MHKGSYPAFFYFLHNQMRMIGHQTISPYGYQFFSARQSKDVFVRDIFNKFEIDRFSIISKVKQSVKTFKIFLIYKNITFFNALAIEMIPFTGGKRNSTI